MRRVVAGMRVWWRGVGGAATPGAPFYRVVSTRVGYVTRGSPGTDLGRAKRNVIVSGFSRSNAISGVNQDLIVA